MKLAAICCSLVVGLSAAAAQEFVAEKVQGEVMVRHGVQEEWKPVATMERLKPHDSMKTGKGGSAVLLVPGTGDPVRMTIPPEVILDLSDVRTLSREELILKLTMERVRAAPYEWKDQDLDIPNATVVHGSDRNGDRVGDEEAVETGRMQMNGARVLFRNGFFPTCALRGLSLFARFPSLSGSFNDRLLVAESLQRSDLPGEALTEYNALAALPDLTPDEKALVQDRIEGIREAR